MARPAVAILITDMVFRRRPEVAVEDCLRRPVARISANSGYPTYKEHNYSDGHCA